VPVDRAPESAPATEPLVTDDPALTP
jgi:hypothetical protein